jgi:hypothetical protein
MLSAAGVNRLRRRNEDYVMEKYINCDAVRMCVVDNVNNSVAALIYSGTAFARLRRTNMPRCARRYATCMCATPLTNQCRYGIYKAPLSEEMSRGAFPAWQ